MGNRKLIIKGFFIVFAFITNSCVDSICTSIVTQLEIAKSDTGTTNCLVDFKDLFQEPWDKIYIFIGFYTPEEISEVIDIDYKGKVIYDPSILILLISNNLVMNSYKTECLELNFDRMLKNGYVKIDKNKSIVLFNKVQNLGETEYYLFQEDDL